MEGHLRVKVKPYEWSLNPSPITSSCLPLTSLSSISYSTLSTPHPTQLHSSLRRASGMLGMLLRQDFCSSCSPYLKILLSAITCLPPLTLCSNVTFPTRLTLTILFTIVLNGTPLPCFFFPHRIYNLFLAYYFPKFIVNLTTRKHSP